MSSVETVQRYLEDAPGGITWERVADGFWYVRVPGVNKRVIPIELQADERTLRVLTYFMIPPDENQAEAYRYLLRQNFAGSGVAFAVAPDGALCIVTRIPLDDLDADALDAAVGKIVDATETTFQSYLRIGFPAFFRRGAWGV